MDRSRTSQIVGTFCLLLCCTAVFAGAPEQARRIHDRLAGVPPSPAELALMTADIEGGDALAAARRAMAHPDFYRSTLRIFATPWTNREGDVFAPLNDYSATIIGMVRDDADFREVLMGDYLYVGAGVSPGYSPDDNAHYEALQAQQADLAAVLVRESQANLQGLPPGAAAGVMTSRAAARAFFIAGTNRAMLRFTLMNHLCHDLEQLADTTRAPDRIRQDVTRSPGGDSRLFRNNCVGCHSGMDPLAQAFAYYDFTYPDDMPDAGRLQYNGAGQTDPLTGSRVARKYHINAGNFPPGFVTPDDRWTNYWREGVNERLGWSPLLPGEGEGAASLGEELAQSEAFATCQVQKVFRQVCLRDPVDASDRAAMAAMTGDFVASGYRLRDVFSATAVHCMGD